jgi:ABC-type uncharacterized transport system auxiliary subunit
VEKLRFKSEKKLQVVTIIAVICVLTSCSKIFAETTTIHLTPSHHTALDESEAMYCNTVGIRKLMNKETKNMKILYLSKMENSNIAVLTSNSKMFYIPEIGYAEAKSLLKANTIEIWDDTCVQIVIIDK